MVDIDVSFSLRIRSGRRDLRWLLRLVYTVASLAVIGFALSGDSPLSETGSRS